MDSNLPTIGETQPYKFNGKEFDGLETSKGTLSPATILEHEMDHGVNCQTNTAEHIRDQGTKDSHFENNDEKISNFSFCCFICCLPT